MKFFNITLLFVIVAVICFASSTLAQDDGPQAGAKRIALRRTNGGKSVKTTTTTQAPSGDEGDYADDNGEAQYGDEGDDEAQAPASSTTSTTEAPKKTVGPVIRPFRSNDDFLNSLKRRQMDAKKHRSAKPTPKSKPATPSKNEDEGDEEDEEPAAAAPAPTKSFKGNPALNRRKLTKPGKPEPASDDTAAEESEQQQQEDAKPKRPSGRFTLRKRN